MLLTEKFHTIMSLDCITGHNLKVIAYSYIKLSSVKSHKCGSLVLSNLVTFSDSCWEFTVICTVTELTRGTSDTVLSVSVPCFVAMYFLKTFAQMAIADCWSPQSIKLLYLGLIANFLRFLSQCMQ